jgi:hypothetical protein
MKKMLLTMALAAACSPALAKLPDATPEAKAKLDETAARVAWAGKVDGFQLCESQNKVAAKYRADAQAAGKEVKPAPPTPPCSEPGPFAYTPAATRGLEASEAHSPAEPAASPPSVRQTEHEKGITDSKTPAAR